MIYHVAKTGSLKAAGTQQEPFLTIQQAADIMRAGDSVVVHEGIYREWVRPANGGSAEGKRITYMAAPGEHVEITGAEVITDWTAVEGSVYKTELSNTFFGSFNPYTTRVYGDWWCGPFDYEIHAGDVYIDGLSAYEAPSKLSLIHI